MLQLVRIINVNNQKSNSLILVLYAIVECRLDDNKIRDMDVSQLFKKRMIQIYRKFQRPVEEGQKTREQPDSVFYNLFTFIFCKAGKTFWTICFLISWDIQVNNTPCQLELEYHTKPYHSLTHPGHLHMKYMKAKL